MQVFLFGCVGARNKLSNVTVNICCTLLQVCTIQHSTHCASTPTVHPPICAPTHAMFTVLCQALFIYQSPFSTPLELSNTSLIHPWHFPCPANFELKCWPFTVGPSYIPALSVSVYPDRVHPTRKLYRSTSSENGIFESEQGCRLMCNRAQLFDLWLCRPGATEARSQVGVGAVSGCQVRF